MKTFLVTVKLNIKLLIIGWTEEEAEPFTFDVLPPLAREYMKEKYRIQGKNPDDVTEKEVETMFWYMKLAWIVSILKKKCM